MRSRSSIKAAVLLPLTFGLECHSQLDINKLDSMRILVPDGPGRRTTSVGLT